MRALISILINIAILYFMTYLLSANPDKGIEAGIVVAGGIKTYIIGGIVLGFLNSFIRPFLKLVSAPFFFLFFGLIGFVVNGVILKLFGYIVNDILVIPGISYTINGWVNFVIAVAIFTLLNMVYSLIFFKKK